jgi:hypothetical protein
LRMIGHVKRKYMFVEGKDYYVDTTGHKVLTESFLLRRGYCCRSSCRHCPYEFDEEIDPTIPIELQLESLKEKGEY